MLLGRSLLSGRCFCKPIYTKSRTGSGQDRYALADGISGAWVAFARTGDPNHKGLPNWPSFNNTERATMILNNECKVIKDPDREERLAFRALHMSRRSIL
jgi:carboxylesterase type B